MTDFQIIQSQLSEILNRLSELKQRQVTSIPTFKEESQVKMSKFGYNYKGKYNPISYKEVYTYLDLFVEDFFLYNQYYYDYYKLIWKKSDFDFTVYLQNFQDEYLNGAQFLYIEKFPIVHVDDFVYNYTHYTFENLPNQKREVKFQVLGKYLVPTEGDIINIHGFQFLVYRVEHDLRHDLYLCTQKDLWTMEEFEEHIRLGNFRVITKVEELLETRTVSQTFEIVVPRKNTDTEDFFYTRYEYIDRKPKTFDFDEIHINTLD